MFAFIPVVLAAVGLVSASPLEMQKRAAFSPAIVTPDAISRWTAGTQATVTWYANSPKLLWLSKLTSTPKERGHRPC